ncbi:MULTISPECIES: IclR family transcriptional regulator [Streptacidiphilus]|uniref:IclR family transcriptional regulator n=2 Tax=Streptacidiphilus TaxID=228398 RepID=A0ABV6UUS0_9ACTN|nr:IclR family transcriptional regulator [Streptacidiphilus jeojiense]
MSDHPSSMVERVVLILGILERSSEPLTLGQISARSGLPRSSAHRILQQLVSARWLSRDDNEYGLGLRMFEIGSVVVHRTRILGAAGPMLRELNAATGQVVHFAVLDQQDVVYLERIGGPFADALPSRVGGRFPAHCTAVGKVLLANAPRLVVEEYLRAGLRARTGRSIADPGALREALARTLDAGVAAECGEAVPGAACIAAPVFQAGTAVAAVSLCGPQRQILGGGLKVQVQWAAAEISRRLSTPVLSARARPVAVSR